MYRRPEDVAHVLDGDHAVLLHLPSGRRVALSPEGTRIWQLTLDGLEPAEVTVALAAEYDADPDVVGRDVDDFLGQLAEQQFLEPAEGDEPS